ncbi:DUF4177 domain-containing protein [Ostreiculturibacter nitratireducens]|uniref:DUF4177 domain-containing protein n=1 Tax=Ostreiculturibacter nitratireducens TaxID=3075226 RepID=UPI0031B5AEF0
MQKFEYKAVPAPMRGEKARGVKTTADRFAHALTLAMNEMARDGWEYLRADTLPCEERTGLTGRSTSFQHVLVFRRPFEEAAEAEAAERPLLLPQMRSRSTEGTAPRLAGDAGEGSAPKLGPAGGRGMAAG